jgi:hypothetical protein
MPASTLDPHLKDPLRVRDEADPPTDSEREMEDVTNNVAPKPAGSAPSCSATSAKIASSSTSGAVYKLKVAILVVKLVFFTLLITGLCLYFYGEKHNNVKSDSVGDGGASTSLFSKLQNQLTAAQEEVSELMGGNHKFMEKEDIETQLDALDAAEKKAETERKFWEGMEKGTLVDVVSV